MMKTKFRVVLFSAVLMTFACIPSVLAQSPPRWFVDFEAGSVFPDYCDVRIPGDTGILFSLTDDFSTSSSLFVRLRAGFRFPFFLRGYLPSGSSYLRPSISEWPGPSSTV